LAQAVAMVFFWANECEKGFITLFGQQCKEIPAFAKPWTLTAKELAC
jgi:hypothetical protein